MTQTWALIVDAYRELNSRKLFWVTIALSLVCAAALGSVGIDEKGVSVLAWRLPFEVFNTNFVPRSAFYKSLFEAVGFNFWLSWAAMILAMISTASIIPDFVSSGSIELLLSKPISRLRLFLSKYLVGVAFVGLQVAIFCTAAFLIVGARGGGWVWPFFWAAPLAMLFFSYLFCISAIIGLLTRSSIAAVIVAGLFWMGIAGVSNTENILLTFRTQYGLARQVSQADLDGRREQIETLEKLVGESPTPAPAAADQADQAKGDGGGTDTGGAAPGAGAGGARSGDAVGPVDPASGKSPAGPGAEGGAAEGPVATAQPGKTGQGSGGAAAGQTPWATVQQLISESLAPKAQRGSQEELLAKLRRDLADKLTKHEEIELMARNLTWYHNLAYSVKTFLPKTGETMLVLRHKLLDEEETEALVGANQRRSRPISVNGTMVSMKTLSTEVDKVLRERSLTWVIGTSLAFEAVVLGAACIVFIRRDF